MATRQWTKEELDDVQRLPDGWDWCIWKPVPVAHRAADGAEVWIEHGRLVSSKVIEVPPGIMLALSEVTIGLDSREWIARNLDEAEKHGEHERVAGGGLPSAGAVEAFRVAAKLVLSGRVPKTTADADTIAGQAFSIPQRPLADQHPADPQDEATKRARLAWALQHESRVAVCHIDGGRWVETRGVLNEVERGIYSISDGTSTWFWPSMSSIVRVDILPEQAPEGEQR
jgi:hypothetical protein